MSIDKIYTVDGSGERPFEFNTTVADVFSDMLNRSIPGYRQIIEQIGIFSTKFAVDNTNIYDLGASLGAASLSVKRSIRKNCKIISVDNSEAMVARCKSALSRDNSNVDFEVIESNIEDIKISNASIVILNFTLQFINPQIRKKIISTIYDGLIDGGVLILSEKIKFDDNDKSEYYDSLYYDFKRANGYSELEISRKRDALENVLIRDTATIHVDRMKKCGFRKVDEWFSYLNFSSFLALK